MSGPRTVHGGRGVVAASILLVLALAAGACGGGAEDVSMTAPGTVRPPTSVLRANPVEVERPPRSWTVQALDDRPIRVEVVVGGDLLIHRAVWESAGANAGGAGFDFGAMFEVVRPFVESADLALCHLEVPLSADSSDLSSFPIFNAPFQLADAVVGAGFDGCSVASNHTLDQGTQGIDATLGHLDRVGLGHSGAARTAEEAAAIPLYEVVGRSIAHLSYAYGFNGFRVPADEPWRVNQIDAARIVDDAARARGAGADLVLVSLHFGTEYQWRPSAYQRDVVEAVTASPDIDLIIGHHAHVVQPVGLVAGTPVIYGLGNLLSNMTQPERRDGVLVRAAFDLVPGAEPALVGIDALPTEVDRLDGHRIVVAGPDSWDRTIRVLNSEAPMVAPVELLAKDPAA